MEVHKLTQSLKEKWWFYINDKDEGWPDSIMFEKGYLGWRSCMKFLAFKGERKEEDRRETNRDIRFSKKIALQCYFECERKGANANCPPADATHKFWSSPLISNMSVKDRYAALRKQRFCYRCLGKGYACGINGCFKNDN